MNDEVVFIIDELTNSDIEIIEEYIKNVPESVKYKQKSIHNNVDRGKE